ncbi:MAG: class I SAM-dependent methyltransferase [Thiotrichaceae bacterium]|nr:class I SAM-dependent methyltransferase [Thiotrichaceae bacterium]
MNNFSDQQIIDSWRINARPWVTAVREGEIESRLQVTNKAIIDSIIERNPKTVLDAGCGEGWLVRELSKLSVSSLGIDVVPELIIFAQKEGGGRFKSLAYENLSYDTLKEKFDLIVCNFSLLGNESVVQMFEQVPCLLNKAGAFIVQTIHPAKGCGNEKYVDGWMEGSWEGFNEKFSNPAPWYFRAMETWKTLFINNGFTLTKILEPLNQKTDIAASVIFIGVKNS